MLTVTLTAIDEKELVSLRNKTGDPRSERALMILLSNQGSSPKEIGNQLKRNPHTVRLWIKRYNQNGIAGLERQYSPGRPKKHKDILMRMLPTWLSSSPSVYGFLSSSWTVDLLKHHFQQVTGNSVSQDTIERALKESGYSYRRAKKGIPTNAPSKEEKRQHVLRLIGEIKDFIGQDEAVILSLDETHLSTEPYVIQGWYKKNSTPSSLPNQKGELHDIWRLEYRGTTIYLEKRQEGQQ